MKLQDLDKTKRYDLSECTDEELMCVLNWLQNDDKNWLRCDISDLKFHQLEYSNYHKWLTDYIEFPADIVKPTFIQENKQDQFLNELQQLCKKYDTTLDAYGGLGVITKTENEIIESDLNFIDENLIDFNHKAYYQKNCNNS